MSEYYYNNRVPYGQQLIQKIKKNYETHIKKNHTRYVEIIKILKNQIKDELEKFSNQNFYNQTTNIDIVIKLQDFELSPETYYFIILPDLNVYMQKYENIKINYKDTFDQFISSYISENNLRIKVDLI